MSLENLRIAKSGMDDTIYAGHLNKDKVSWKDKVDVTNDVIRAIIERWGGFKQILKSSNGEEYEIIVKKLNKSSTNKQVLE